MRQYFNIYNPPPLGDPKTKEYLDYLSQEINRAFAAITANTGSSGTVHNRAHSLLSILDHTNVASYINQPLLTTSGPAFSALNLTYATPFINFNDTSLASPAGRFSISDASDSLIIYGMDATGLSYDAILTLYRPDSGTAALLNVGLTVTDYCELSIQPKLSGTGKGLLTIHNHAAEIGWYHYNVGTTVHGGSLILMGDDSLQLITGAGLSLNQGFTVTTAMTTLTTPLTLSHTNYTTAGILHNAVTTGIISSSLIVAADIDATIVPTFAGVYIKDGVTTIGSFLKKGATASTEIDLKPYGAISWGAYGLVNTDGNSRLDVNAVFRFQGGGNIQLDTIANTFGAAGIAHIAPPAGNGVVSSSLIVNADVSATAAILYSKMQSMVGNGLMGNMTGATNPATELSVANVKTLLGYYTSGDSPSFAGLTLSGFTTAGIVHNAVTTGILSSSLIVAADVTGHTLTYATLQEASAPCILGKFTAGAGDIAELALDLADTTHWLRKDGTWTTVSAAFPALENTKIWIGDVSNVAQKFALSGDVTMTASGVTTIGKIAAMTTAGIVHNAVTTGVLSSSLIVDADVSATAAIATTKLGAGAVVQVVNFTQLTFTHGHTAIPIDNSIPEKTQGDEYLSATITPKSATNKLRIDVVLVGGPTSLNTCIVALFQGTATNAVAATADTIVGGYLATFKLTYFMTVGAIAGVATTFSVRAGTGSTDTFTLNGTAETQYLGGVMTSSLTITEIVA